MTEGAPAGMTEEAGGMTKHDKGTRAYVDQRAYIF